MTMAKLSRAQVERLEAEILSLLRSNVHKVRAASVMNVFDQEVRPRLEFLTDEGRVIPMAGGGSKEAEHISVTQFLADVSQLLHEKYVEGGEDVSGESGSASPRSPRHRAQWAVRPLIEEWGVAGFDNDDLSDLLPSARVLARRVVDALEPTLKAAYDAGCLAGGGEDCAAWSFDKWYLGK